MKKKNWLRETDPKKITEHIAEVNTSFSTPNGRRKLRRDFQKLEKFAQELRSMTEPKGPDVIFIPEM